MSTNPYQPPGDPVTDSESDESSGGTPNGSDWLAHLITGILVVPAIGVMIIVAIILFAVGG